MASVLNALSGDVVEENNILQICNYIEKLIFNKNNELAFKENKISLFEALRNEALSSLESFLQKIN